MFNLVSWIRKLLRTGSGQASFAPTRSCRLHVEEFEPRIVPSAQWANAIVNYSTQYTATHWAANQAPGVPDTLSYGDITTAWAPLPINSGGIYDRYEHLTVRFANPVNATGVVIRETYGNGFVYRVDFLYVNPAGVAQTIHTWTGIDPSQPGSPANFRISIPRTILPVNAVKIYVDIDHNLNAWEEIDAVQLLDFANNAPSDVISVSYLPTGQGTTGDLSNDNPSGGDGPSFGGGFRFFPDAATYATRTESRNIVRIRATVAPAAAGVMVHFRSFDVDDPSLNPDIDPNDETGSTGRDNRGTVVGANLQTPGPVAAAGSNGYRGRLRPVGGAFADEGAVLSVPTVIDLAGNAIVEVELATSFNPGDNFRVVAATNLATVQGLNDTNDLPTNGATPAIPPQMVTDQLSIWRRFHIESDRMATIPFGLRQTGAINVNGVANLGQVAAVQLNFQINQANGFRGGNLRDSVGNRYAIITHDTANPSNVLVRVIVPPGQMQGVAPAVGAVELTQGDFQGGNITAGFVPQGGQYQVTTDINITDVDEYYGGILRANGINYPIVSHTTGPNATVTVDFGGGVEPSGPTQIYQDDFTASYNDPPVPRIATPDNANFYDMTQVSTVRANNRYADAYMEAEYTQLAPFNSNNVTPVSHFPDMGSQMLGITEPYRGTSPGGAARPADYETPVFWSVYVLAGHEFWYQDDYDGTGGGVLGVTAGRTPTEIEGEVSAVFTETIRDVVATSGTTLTEATARARTVTHEIGHQFGLSRLPTDPNLPSPDTHSVSPSVMSAQTGGVSDAEFYFLPWDIVYLRRRVLPPGPPPP